MASLLVIEDERKVLSGLQRGLSDEGYEAFGASAGDTGSHFDEFKANGE